MIRVQVKLFALLRDRAGISELPLELSEGATVATARDAVASRLPELRDVMKRVACAVNREYANADTVLRDGDELALIPPVSGG